MRDLGKHVVPVLTSAPGSPVDGQTYFNTTSNKYFIYDFGNAVWIDLTPGANGFGVVNHGAVASTPRPIGYLYIQWVGSVEPTNAINGDTWINTT